MSEISTVRAAPPPRQRRRDRSWCRLATRRRLFATTAQPRMRGSGTHQGDEAPVARDEKLHLLYRIPLLSSLDKHKIARVGELTEEVDVPAGKGLIPQRD